MLEQASKKLHQDDFTLQYFRSIQDAVEKSLGGGNVLTLPPSFFNRYDHSDEFITSVGVLALHHLHNQRVEQSGLLLNEMINYYSDCIGESSRRAGEMLWMLAATELAPVDELVATLIRISCVKAMDQYLVTRFDDHVTHMVEMHGFTNVTVRWLKLAVESRSRSAISSDSDCLHLLIFLSDALKMQGDLEELEAIRKRIERARERANASIAGRSLRSLKPGFRSLIGQNLHLSRLYVTKQMRSIKLVEILLSKGSLIEAEAAWHDAVLHCTAQTLMPNLQAVTKNLFEQLISQNMFDKAALIAHNPQLRKFDCGFYAARLASACIKSGDLFAGAAILLQAFAEVDSTEPS